MKKVVVVGGGISGLASAYFVQELCRERNEEVSLLVLEEEDTPGGKMKTFHEEGFIVEWGPNGFLTNKPDTLTLCRSLGIDQMLFKSSDSSRKRYVFVDGALKKLPESPGEFFASDILSLKGRARVALEPFIPAKDDEEEESLFDFATRRLGVEAAERLIEPMAAGVYAGNPESMSLRSCFPLIYGLERNYGGLVKGMIAKMRERKRLGVTGEGGPAGPGGVLMSFYGGVMSFIEEIVARSEFSLSLRSRVSRIDRGSNGSFRVRWLRDTEEVSKDADAVVVSTPAYVTAPLVKGVDPRLSELIGDIPYSPISLVALGIEREGYDEVLDAFGFLVPRVEGRKVLGILFDSSIFTNRAPEGSALIRGMIGGARNPGLAGYPDDSLVQMMRQEVEGILGITRAPHFVRVYRHEKGIPQYRVGHPSLVGKIKERLTESPGLFLNNNAYEGIGLNDCVSNSRVCANMVVEYLTG